MAFDDLCRAIGIGDASIGLPPYNGGLFDRKRTSLLCHVRLADDVMASVIDALSFERTPDGRRYINYRDLGVQQLGSIYERLLEREIVRDDGDIVVRPNIFARKDSGSYYTPDDLVELIIKESIDPLIQTRVDAFLAETSSLSSDALSKDHRIDRLRCLDPAERILDIKICDPSMGSGHFLVNLVDKLSDHVMAAMADAEAAWEGYVSPLNERIANIRNAIVSNADERGWAVDQGQLEDRHLVRRMVLKRCVYGVDKNPMAVELAKVSLWLHTFTVGAPLSFLDHHLRCGDSLFGAWVGPTLEKAKRQGSLFLDGPLDQAMQSASSMQIIEGLTDAEIAEAHRSADMFANVSEMTEPLDAFLSLVHAFDWMNLDGKDQDYARIAYPNGAFGDPVEIARGAPPRMAGADDLNRFSTLLEAARELMAEERFLNWQLAFPGVWSDWEASELHGGFDAVIGNPPWDKMKLQNVEWFASRRREIALAHRGADRERMIDRLEKAEDPLGDEYARASKRAFLSVRMVRNGGDYPLLSRGDVDLYSLFVERAMTLVKPDGVVGLLVPSGIACGKTAARFFRGVATGGRLRALYDFENRRTRFRAPNFFPNVDGRFKFCVFVASPSSVGGSAKCGFFLQDLSEVDDDERCFWITADDFVRVNPNTGTAPTFRSRRDAQLTIAIYGRLPLLVNRTFEKSVKTWPIKYTRMFEMAADSELFRTRPELIEKEGAWPLGGNRFKSSDGAWLPLYEGKMVQAFDHRAADVIVNADNLFRPGQQKKLDATTKANPDRLPEPRYWVLDDGLRRTWRESWVVSFKDITAATNRRSMIAAIIPHVCAGHTLPLLPMVECDPDKRASMACFVAANLNSVVFDYVARQKVPTTHFSWHVLEQLPVVPPDRYQTTTFGPKTAARIVREAALELTYTAHDMAPFAKDMGFVDEWGKPSPPFAWNDRRRLDLMAKLDALYFLLYGVTNFEDVRYIYSTFPIVEREERQLYGTYLSLELCIAWLNALNAGEPDAPVDQ